MARRGSWSAELGRVGAAVLACLVAACAATPPGRATSTAAVADAPTPASRPERPVDVVLSLNAPLHAGRLPSVMSAGAPSLPSLGVVVTNRSAAPVDVADLRLHLGAASEGASFRCAEVIGPPPEAREPATLAPGASFVFERALDCTLPLVGAYAVRVAVSFGKDDWRVPRDVRAFSLTVSALPNVEPREIAGVPGLWASMGASGVLHGAGREHGRTLLAIVNATRQPIEVPAMRLVLRTYRAGNPAPCEDEPVSLGIPAVLGPAETYHEPIEVSCLGLSTPGTYDIAAWLVVPRGAEGDREIALGRLRVEVVTDPSKVEPRPWR